MKTRRGTDLWQQRRHELEAILDVSPAQAETILRRMEPLLPWPETRDTLKAGYDPTAIDDFDSYGLHANEAPSSPLYDDK